MRIKLGFEISVVLSNHAALVDIADAVFGDPKKKPPTTGLAPGVNDVTKGLSYEAALGSMNRILQFG